VSSRETIVWSAQHRYPYIALNLPIEESKNVWKIYDQVAKESGYESGPAERGYLIRCHVAETEEKAIRNAREFMWMQGEFTGLTHPVWAAPSGYLGTWARKAMAELRAGYTHVRGVNASLEKQMQNLTLIAGTPKQVIEKLRIIMEETRPSILALYGNDGRISHEDSKTCIRLTGQDVLPEVREIGKKLGLESPFDLNTPVSLAYTNVQAQKPAAASAAAAN
jgi:alkanesulfonate monooxygenase SsuD/methylene tetrahydromethanopterin reductase-like flavin-dependent oxidoreductase (luciferase family)